jgi:hypothetical protein
MLDFDGFFWILLVGRKVKKIRYYLPGDSPVLRPLASVNLLFYE